MKSRLLNQAAAKTLFLRYGLIFLFPVFWVMPVRAQTDSLMVISPEASGLKVSPPSLSPGGALIRSALVPGWGQFYNRNRVKGYTFLLLEAGLAAGMISQRDKSVSGGLTTLGNTFLMSLIGVHLYGVVDAYVDAHFSDFDRMDSVRHPERASPELILGLRITW